MANDGTVKIGTQLDQTGFKSGLSGLGSFAQKGFGLVGGFAKSMASVTVGALTAVSAGLGAAVVSGVKYNAAMEMYIANFSTMLGSEEAALKKVNELKKLGASTPFEMSDLADATTTLLAFGVENEKTIDTVTMLGDVSLGNADKFARLTNAYGKANSMGKLTGETAQMMIEAGFNPLKVISEQTGESMEQLQKRMSKGGISADELTAAFKTATSEGGQFYKGMETASTTFDGLISTLKDNANSLVGEVVKPISDSMTQTLLPEAIGMVGKLTDAFAKDGIPGLINAAGSVVGQIVTGIAKQAPAGINMASGFLITFLTALMAQLPALSTAGVSIVTSLLTAILDNVPLLFALGITLFANLLNGIAQAMPDIIPKALDAIMAMRQTLMDNLPIIIDAGMQILVAVIEGIADAVPALIGYVPSLIDTISNVLVENLPTIIQAAIAILLSLIQGISSAIPQLIKMIPTITNTIMRVLVENLPLIIQTAVRILVALIQGLSDALPKLIEMVPTIVATIVKVLFDNLPLIIQAAVEIIIALVAGLIKQLPYLLDYIPSIVQAVQKVFNDTDWGELGKNLIEGVKNGVLNAAGNLANAAKEAVSKAIDGVKKFLKMNSPSKLMRDVIGKNMMLGTVVGIENESDTLEKSAVDTTKNAVQAMQGVSAADLVGQMQGQAIRRSAAVTPISRATSNASNPAQPLDYDYDKLAKAMSKINQVVEIDKRPFGRIVKEVLA